MRVDITQEIIDRNGRGAFQCPIAYATKETLRAQNPGQDIDVTVAIGYITIYPHEGEYYYLSLPGILYKWYLDYDAHESVKPVSFDVDLNKRTVKVL